jgi:hypothetical protein
VLMGDHSPAIAGLAKAGRITHQHVQRPAAGQGPTESLKGMAEGQMLTARCDPQVAHLRRSSSPWTTRVAK